MDFGTDGANCYGEAMETIFTTVWHNTLDHVCFASLENMFTAPIIPDKSARAESFDKHSYHLRLIWKPQSELDKMFSEEGMGWGATGIKISSQTHNQTGWFVVVIIVAIPNMDISTGHVQKHLEQKGLKQLTIYPLAYRAEWMDEMDGCHRVWLAREFRMMTE